MIHEVLPPPITLTLLLASGAHGTLSAQAMPPTALWNGAQANFLNLANPDTTAEKFAIYAKYYDFGPTLAPGYGAPNPGLMGGGGILVKQLLLGEDLVPSSRIITTTTLTEANQNDEGTGVILAGRKAMLMTYLWDPQSKDGAQEVNAVMEENRGPR